MFLGERGSTILSTPTTVLVCNLCLQPGETKTSENHNMNDVLNIILFVLQYESFLLQSWSSYIQIKRQSKHSRKEMVTKNSICIPLSSLFSAVSYSEQVPAGGPPSFNGRLVKYIYKLAVGAQRPGCPAQISRIPFHVRTIPGMYIQLTVYLSVAGVFCAMISDWRRFW